MTKGHASYINLSLTHIVQTWCKLSTDGAMLIDIKCVSKFELRKL